MSNFFPISTTLAQVFNTYVGCDLCSLLFNLYTEKRSFFLYLSFKFTSFENSDSPYPWMRILLSALQSSSCSALFSISSNSAPSFNIELKLFQFTVLALCIVPCIDSVNSPSLFGLTGEHECSPKCLIIILSKSCGNSKYFLAAQALLSPTFPQLLHSPFGVNCLLFTLVF